MDKRDEIEEKTGRVVRLLNEEGLAGVLMSAQHNFAWLTCGGSNGIDTSREAGAGSLFIRSDGRRFVLANRIEMPRLLAEAVSENDFEPVEFAWEQERSRASYIAERALSLVEGGQGIGSDLPAGESARIIEGAIAAARSRLTAGEVERIRALGQDAGRAIGGLARRIEPGLTEWEIARRAADALAAVGAQTVVGLVAADDRLAKFRHPPPTDRRWEKIVMIVVCARRGGLIVSLTRIVSAGDVPAELEGITEATARVNAELYAATRPGAVGADLYRLIARAYASEGFPGEERLHHQGGAAGYRTREWVAHPESEDVVQASQAFAWNPSITGTKVEETALAFEERLEVITSSPDWPFIAVNKSGQEYRLPGVLSL